MNSILQQLRELRAAQPSAMADLDATAVHAADDEPCPWEDPAVAAARREAERLGVVDVVFVPGPAYRWIVDPEFARLPAGIRALVRERPGWTPPAWATELRRKASRCHAMHSDIAKRYEKAARILSGHSLTGISIG